MSENKLSYNMQHYNKLKPYPIECPYCKSITHIRNLRIHLKGISCQKIKELLLKNDNELENKFMIEINNIKKKLRNGNYDELNYD